MAPAETQSSTATVLQQLIYNYTQQTTTVTVHRIIGDGNCLFRAISLGLTGSQDHHNIICDKITDHMLHDTIRQNIEPMFDDSATYNNHVQEMKKMAHVVLSKR